MELEKVTNRAVMEKIKKDLKIMNTIKRRNVEYLGKFVLQGKANGRRPPGRRRIPWLKNLITWWCSKTTTELFKAAVNKVILSRMIVNIRNE